MNRYMMASSMVLTHRFPVVIADSQLCTLYLRSKSTIYNLFNLTSTIPTYANAQYTSIPVGI